MYDTLIFNDILKIFCAHYLSIPGIITARSGQREPPRLVLGGTSSAFQAWLPNFKGMATYKVKFPPTPHFKHRSGGFMLAWPSCIHIHNAHNTHHIIYFACVCRSVGATACLGTPVRIQYTGVGRESMWHSQLSVLLSWTIFISCG